MPAIAAGAFDAVLFDLDGTLIDTAPDMVRAPHAVEAGGAVTVRLAEGPLTLEMKAVALQDGGLGEAIRVRNPETGRTICAVVREAAMVEVC